MAQFIYLEADDWGRRFAHAPAHEKLGDPEVFYHHTAGSHLGTSLEVLRRMNEADIARGYACIGYDIVVHRDVTTGVVAIAEGRGGFRSAATLDRNEEGEAICLVGHFHPGAPLKYSRHPHPDELEGLALATVWGIERGWISSSYAPLGHRDNPAHPGATACPGDYLYPHIAGTVTPRVRELLGTVTPPPLPPPILEDDVFVFIQPEAPIFKKGIFTLDGHPVTQNTLDAIKANKGKIVIVKQAPHAHWEEATLHRMGEQARRQYGDDPNG